MPAKSRKKKPLVVTVLSILQDVWFIIWIAVHFFLMIWIFAPEWVIFQLPMWAKWLAWVFWLLGGGCLVFFLKGLKEDKLEQAGYGIKALESTLGESTQNEQVEDKRMTTARDADNRIVVHFPTWVRGLGGFFILMGAGFLYGSLTLMGKEMVLPIVFLCLGLPALLGGIWIMSYTFQLIFDHALGDMTIRTGIGPFIYRTRHILSEQVQSVRAFTSEEGPYVRVWAASLKIAGRKKEMKIIDTMDESRVTYVAGRITAFLEQYQKISKD